MLEDLLLKDNENMPFLDDASLVPERQGFAPNEMVRCDVCLRSNPPTRANCLYCAAALPAAKRIIEQPSVVLKPIADSILGFNCILISHDANSATNISNAAQLLNISSAELEKIIVAEVPLPLARTNTSAEAELIVKQLSSLGFEVKIVSDAELGSVESDVRSIRAATISESGMTLKQIGGSEGVHVAWSEIVLIVSGRLLSKRVESAEQKHRRGEVEVLEAAEFFTDEMVVDLYIKARAESFRIVATKFDFSSLPGRGLLTAENFGKLLNLIRTNANEARYDDSYLRVRQNLDLVWHAEQRKGSAGWRRDRPGKYALEAITESSNVNQFTRYSRLRYLLFMRGQSGN